MPGICGIIGSLSSGVATTAVQAMIECMLHDPSYVSGSFTDTEQNCCIGWTNLKGSFSSCLPIWNERKDIALFFYGETFLPDQLILELKQRHSISDVFDARWLVHLYEDQPDCFLQTLNGFFHGVLLDLRIGRVVVFNDRYGMQRLYYYHDDQIFIFSSEAKALLNVRKESREICLQGLGELLTLRCVLENRTLFKNVFLLPGASRWQFRHGVCERKEQYFHPRVLEQQSTVSQEIFYQELKHLFANIVSSYLESRQRLGCSLTGGLDSRLILANCRLPPGSLPCYTFGSIYNDSFDVKVARRVAKVCKQPHLTIKVDEDYCKRFSTLAQRAVYISDGNIDAASGAVELYVNERAREIAPLRMTGNYGSEVLRSVTAFKYSMPDQQVFNVDFLEHLHNAQISFNRIRNIHSVTFAAFRQAPWYNYNRLALEQSLLTIRTPYLDNAIVCCLYKAPKAALCSDALCLRLLRDTNPELAAIITNKGAGGVASHLYTKLQQLYYEFWHKAEYCYDYKMPNFAARLDYILKPLSLNRIFVGRQKFYNYRLWYRDKFADFVRDILLSQRCLGRPLLNRKYVEYVVGAHVSGRGNYTNVITMLLTYELTQRLLIEAN